MLKRFAPYLVVAAALLWSADALLRTPLTTNLSATTIVFYEHLFGLLLVLPFLVRGLKQLRALGRNEWLAVLFIALGGSLLATVFFTASFSYVSPSVAILLQKMQPLVAILLAATFLKERLSRFFWPWALVAIAGAYIVSFPNLNPGSLITYDGSHRGIVLALAAAFFWGASTVFGRFVLAKTSFQLMTGLRISLAFVMLGGYLLVSGHAGELANVGAHDMWRLIAIACFTGTGALFIYYRGLADTRASISTIAELAFPFSAVILNWLFLGFALSAVQIAGGLLLVLAIYRLSEENRRMSLESRLAGETKLNAPYANQ